MLFHSEPWKFELECITETRDMLPWEEGYSPYVVQKKATGRYEFVLKVYFAGELAFKLDSRQEPEEGHMFIRMLDRDTPDPFRRLIEDANKAYQKQKEQGI